MRMSCTSDTGKINHLLKNLQTIECLQLIKQLKKKGSIQKKTKSIYMYISNWIWLELCPNQFAPFGLTKLPLIQFDWTQLLWHVGNGVSVNNSGHPPKADHAPYGEGGGGGGGGGGRQGHSGTTRWVAEGGLVWLERTGVAHQPSSFDIPSCCFLPEKHALIARAVEMRLEK